MVVRRRGPESAAFLIWARRKLKKHPLSHKELAFRFGVPLNTFKDWLKGGKFLDWFPGVCVQVLEETPSVDEIQAIMEEEAAKRDAGTPEEG